MTKMLSNRCSKWCSIFGSPSLRDAKMNHLLQQTKWFTKTRERNDSFGTPIIWCATASGRPLLPFPQRGHEVWQGSEGGAVRGGQPAVEMAGLSCWSWWSPARLRGIHFPGVATPVRLCVGPHLLLPRHCFHHCSLALPPWPQPSSCRRRCRRRRPNMGRLLEVDVFGALIFHLTETH
jgi:hypothetical protein